MKICADMCNGSKHMVADMTTRIDRNTRIAKKSVKICLQEPLRISVNVDGENKRVKEQEHKSPIIVLNYKISANSVDYEAFDIATSCISEWKKYFKLKNINV